MRTEASKLALTGMVLDLSKTYPIKDWTLIEIGSYSGDSTEIFCRYFKHVIAIDPWMSNVGGITNKVDMCTIFDMFKDKVKDCKNLTIMQGFSYNQCVKIKNKSVDMVYIDGSHKYIDVKCDIANYLPKIKSGGIISGHDYCNKFPGVMKAVEEMLGMPFKCYPDTSWLDKVD